MSNKNNFKILNISELPKHGHAGIAWRKIKQGCIIKTQHDNYGYNEFEVIKYENRRLHLKYNNNIFDIASRDFIRGRIGRLLGEVTKDFKYKVGDIFDEIQITDREYRVNKNGQSMKYYKYMCSNCGWTDGWIGESNLKKGRRCGCCGKSNKRAVLGINSIYDTHRYLVNEFGLNVEFAKTHTIGTGKKGKFICKDCGSEKSQYINHVLESKSISCNCGDGYSFPSKFIFSVLRQLGVNFITELSSQQLNWCKDKRYDFYMEETNTIIEVHGGQHYIESGRGRSLKEEQENDRYKKELAFKNGIKNYIVIDARKSDKDWIKESVFKSEINKMYDLSGVDWDKALEFACNNSVKEVCHYWEQSRGDITLLELSEIFSIHYNTVVRYLKKGAKIGWCEYKHEDEIKRTFQKKLKKIQISKNNVSLGIFTAAELEELSLDMFGVKFNKDSIYSVCVGKSKTYKGYEFKYI